MFAKEELKTKLLSEYTTTNLTTKGLNACFITRINVLDALDNPKGIMIHSNSPSHA